MRHGLIYVSEGLGYESVRCTIPNRYLRYAQSVIESLSSTFLNLASHRAFSVFFFYGFLNAYFYGMHQSKKR